MEYFSKTAQIDGLSFHLLSCWDSSDEWGTYFSVRLSVETDEQKQLLVSLATSSPRKDTRFLEIRIPAKRLPLSSMDMIGLDGAGPGYHNWQDIYRCKIRFRKGKPRFM